MRIAATVLLLGLLGCQAPQDAASPCKYARCKGVAVITSVFKEGGAVRVRWRFEPKEPCDTLRGSLDGTDQFPDGGEGRSAIVAGNTVKQWDRLPCIREDLIDGECSPVRYLFW